MKKLHYSILFLAFVGVFLSGYYFSQRTAGRDHSDTSGRRILYYVDPMNPSHTSDRPGLAPCGMKFEPVYADGESGGQPSASPSVSMPSGTVKISPERQQIIGVQIGKVEKVSESHTLRALGRVTADENRIYRLLAPTKGYMGDTSTTVPTGSLVKKDQVMTSYYSTELLPVQQAYLLVLGALDRRPDDKSSEDQIGSISAQVRQAEENLKLSGFGESQIREIARTRQVSKYIEQRAPLAGLVVSRNIFPYSRFERDTEFFRIVDLSRVWVLADVFENDEKYIKPGTVARVSLLGQDKVFQARVSDSLPQFDSNSRTYRVRLDAPNPEWVLRPNEFVDVEFSIQLAPALTVPREAILDSGLKKIVFVDLGKGYFEPRKVRIGWNFGDRVEILGGLMPDERIVVSGNFLIDSESRMKLAAAGMQGTTAMDPVCGMEVSEKTSKASGNSSELNGATYYFCSPECKYEFDGNPKRFVKDKVEEAPRREQTASPAPSEEATAQMPGEHGAHMGHQHTGDKAHESSVQNTPNSDNKMYEPAAEKTPRVDNQHEQPVITSPQVDPVCGEEVDPEKAETAGHTSEFDGTVFYFCSESCKQNFDIQEMRNEQQMEEMPSHLENTPALSIESHAVDNE